MSRPSLKLRLLLLTAAVLLSLPLAELALRLAHQPREWARQPTFDPNWGRLIHRRSTNPALLYELAPNVDASIFGVQVRTNSFGMRSPEVALPKPAGTRRLAVLGDSITFGWKVEQEETYAAVLQGIFTRSGRAVEVLNLGVSGYGTRQEVSLFLDRAAALEPDVVVIGYCLNDPGDEPMQPLTSFYQPDEWWKHSNLLRLLRKAWWKAQIRWYGGGDYEVYLHRRPDYWLSVTNSFTRLGAWSQARQVPVIVMVFPDLGHLLDESYPYTGLHAQVRAAAEQRGFAVLDLVETYRPFAPERLRVAADDNHPSALGHRLAAESLFSFIGKTCPGWSAETAAPTEK